VVQSLFATMVGLPVERPALCRPLPLPLPLAAAVHITGAWNGSVLLGASEGLARRVASRMLQCTEAEVGPADLDDALAEMVNILGGGIKALVPGPSQLSLPTVLHSREYVWQVPNTACLACQAFYCQGQPMTVRLLRALSDWQGRDATRQV
jgi:chemotaxis protein CheX